MFETLITEADLAKILGMTRHAVLVRRNRGDGPAHLKLGSGPSAPIRYRLSDVEAWLADQEVAREEAAAAK